MKALLILFLLASCASPTYKIEYICNEYDETHYCESYREVCRDIESGRFVSRDKCKSLGMDWY